MQTSKQNTRKHNKHKQRTNPKKTAKTTTKGINNRRYINNRKRERE